MVDERHDQLGAAHFEERAAAWETKSSMGEASTYTTKPGPGPLDGPLVEQERHRADEE